MRYADKTPTPVINPQQNSVRFLRPAVRLEEGR